MRKLLPALLAAAALAVSLTGSSPAAGSCTAQADGHIHVSVGGCTFNGAFQAASAGDTIYVDSGTYAPQGDSTGITRIFRSSRPVGSALVMFVRAPGSPTAPVLNGNIEAGYTTTLNNDTRAPSDFGFRGFTIRGGIQLRPGVNNVVWDQMLSGSVRCMSCHNFLVTNSEMDGRMTPDSVNTINSIDPARVPGCDANCLQPDNVTFDHDYMHDFVVTDPANHSECGQFWPGWLRDVTFTNNVLQNCTDFGILVKVARLSNDLFANNMFDIPMPGNSATISCTPGCPRGGTSLRFDDNATGTPNISNVQVIHNTMLGSLTIDDPTGFTRTDDLVGSAASAAVIDPNTQDGTMNLHLKPGSTAIDAGTLNSPSTDIDGDARPLGPRSDVGADEAIVIPPDTTSPVLSLPADITVPATGPSGANVSFTVTATDDSGTANVSCDRASGTLFPIGTTTVNCTATDPSGNKATGSFKVTVIADTQPPSVPSGLALSAADSSGVTVSWQASTDNVQVAGYDVFVDGVKVQTVTDLDATVALDPSAASHTVSVAAFDTSGNESAQASLTVTRTWST